MMSYVKHQQLVRGLSGMVAKVYDTIPIDSPWGLTQIMGEMSRQGTALALDSLQHCLYRLESIGLVKRHDGTRYQRVRYRPAPSPIEEPEESPMAAAAPVKVITPQNITPTDKLGAFAGRLRKIGEELVALAADIENAAITTPESGAMLTIVRAFSATKDVKFNSVVHLENGSIGFNYVETVQQESTPGQLKMPEKFAITIPVFRGGVRYIIDANLRFRCGQGTLTLWYDLVRPQKILEHAFNAVVDDIRSAVNPKVGGDQESAGLAPIPFFDA